MNRKITGIILMIIMLLSIMTMFILPSAAEENPAASYEGKKIGILTGSIHDKLVKEYYPGAEEIGE